MKAGAGRLARLGKRHLVLLALLPLLIVVWIPVLGGGSRRAPTPPPAAPAVTEPEPPSTSGSAETPPAPLGESAAAAMPLVIASTRELTTRLATLATPYRPRWSIRRGDPFVPATAAAVRPAAAPPATPTDEVTDRQDTDLEPSAVLLSEGQPPLAIIGGRSCRPGDDVAGHTIVTIEERRVVYRRADRTFAVSIRSPALDQEPTHD